MIINGNSLEELKTLQEGSIDAIVTDPPYELGFMGKAWDATGIAYNVELWKEALRVLKPGGHLLAFSGTRTYHRMAVAIEDAGFEVRDMLEWIYASGFPKSLNIGKAVDKICGETGRKEKFVDWMKTTGLTPKIVDDKLKECGVISQTSNFAIHYFNLGQPAIPTLEMWKIVRPMCGEIPQWVDDLVERIEREREVIGGNKNWGQMSESAKFTGGQEWSITKGNSEWEGFGTALKPAHENMVLARKPFDTRSDIDYTVSICQTLLAQIAKNSSEFNLSEKTQLGIAQLNAVEPLRAEDFSEAMDMLRSGQDTNMNLNIVLSWLNLLEEVWKAQSMSTISMEINLTTELQILNSLEWESILKSIIQANDNRIDGLSADAYNAISLFNAVNLKLKHILAHSVGVPVISKEVANSQGVVGKVPSHEPIVMARKPLSEKTIVENCLKHGTGAIDIDGCRIPSGGHTYSPKGIRSGSGNYVGDNWKPNNEEVTQQGRFPANIICTDDALNDGQITKSHGGGKGSGKTADWGLKSIVASEHLDSGSKSRYFSVDVWAEKHGLLQFPKASKGEKNDGCEGLEAKNNMRVNAPRESEEEKTATKMGNFHPTVKPVQLMAWLVRLVSKEGDTVLDPFLGSGTTGVACKLLGREFIGIELDPEYCKIAEARIDGAKKEANIAPQIPTLF